MKLRQKLLITFLCVALIPTLLVSIVSMVMSKSAVEEQAFSKLVAVRDIKKVQIGNYFAEREHDMSMLASDVTNILDFSSQQDLIDSAHQFNDYFNKLIETKGYYDLFLIDDQGMIFYSAFKESDYQTNLLTGAYKSSNLADLFKIVMANGVFSMTDFSPYAPSNGDPAAFIALPIDTTQGQVVIALQLSIDSINEVMQYRHGMGETGESYLIGSDKLMRSDSFLDPVGHSIGASFAGNVENNGVDTEGARLALNGQTNTKIIIDYNGNPVLSAFTPLEIYGLKWALLTEIDEAEAFAVIDMLMWEISVLVVICILLTIFVAIWISNSILKPLGGEPQEMQSISESIASGDLTFRFEERGNMASIYGAMQKMNTHLLEMMKEIIYDSNNLADISDKTSALSVHSSNSLNNQQGSIETVVAATEEMSVSINEVSANASQTADSAQMAQQSSNDVQQKLSETMVELETLDTQLSDASSVLEELEKESSNIGSVLEVIRGIADQTNLLALNAAIEAARAGEQGRGFAVVADEVRSLASKTQESTANVDTMIDRLQSVSKVAVEAMSKSRAICGKTVSDAQETETLISSMSHEIGNISEMTTLIASAVEDQSSVSEDISRSITIIHDTSSENLTSATEVSNASQEINKIANSLNKLTLEFKV